MTALDSTRTDSQNNTGSGGNFPPRLQARNQWLVTREKKPVAPAEGWQHAENLSGFTEAQDKAEQVGGEVAFCFTEDGPFIGFDLDDVTNNQQFVPEALRIVRALDSYTEISQSGTGLHVIAEGQRLEGRKTRADLSEGGHLEVYDAGRYFVLTGDVYEEYSSVEPRRIPAQVVQVAHLPESDSAAATGQQKPASEQEFGGGQTDTTPEQVRRTIEAYVADDDYDVDDTVLRLWRGQDESYPSPSEADIAFVAQLYFWCKGDPQLIDACFRASGRMREKWNEIHYANGDTYGEGTIRKVCLSNEDIFGGRYVT